MRAFFVFNFAIENVGQPETIDHLPPAPTAELSHIVKHTKTNDYGKKENLCCFSAGVVLSQRQDDELRTAYAPRGMGDITNPMPLNKFGELMKRRGYIQKRLHEGRRGYVVKVIENQSNRQNAAIRELLTGDNGDSIS